MSVSSEGFYMKDGRLFESVFFTRAGNQDFGLYANDGTDLGRKFFQGEGSHETGYQRSDGTDIGKLLFDNTSPFSAYLTANVAEGACMNYSCGPDGDGSYGPGAPLANENPIISLVVHPVHGSGLYTYSWRASGSTVTSIFASYGKGRDYGYAVTPTSVSITLTRGWDPYYVDFHDQTWGDHPKHTYIRKQQFAITATATDSLTGASVSPSMTFWAQSTWCYNNCTDCD